MHARQRSPARTARPAAARAARPTRGSTASPGRCRPPPSATTARPSARVSIAASTAGARRRHVALHRRRGQPRVARSTSAGPPRPATMRAKRSAAAPPSSALQRAALAAAGERRPGPPSAAACGRPAPASAASSRGSRAAPVRKSIASRTSSALPAVRPSTWFMSVTSACVGSPAPRATCDQAARQRRAPAPASAQKAPLPTLTSITSASQPGGELLATGCWR